MGSWAEPESGGRLTLLIVLVALCTTISIGALSLRQISQPSTASELLSAGLATAVDIDRYLDDNEELLIELAAGPSEAVTSLPGFPIEVVISPANIREGRESLKETILRRAAARVYQDGTSAFDVTGNQSIELLSAETIVRLLVDRVSDTNCSRAGWIALISSIVLIVSGVAYAFLSIGRRWERPLGTAVVVGTIPGLMFTLLAYFLAGRYGADVDPYAVEIREVLRAAISIPLWNYAICLGAGGAMVAIGIARELVARFWPLNGPVTVSSAPPTAPPAPPADN